MTWRSIRGAVLSIAIAVAPSPVVGQDGGDTSAVLLAAGDVATCTEGTWATARLLDSLPGVIIIPGDVAYLTTRDRNPYVTCFDTTWGRHKSRIRPAIGNHDADIGLEKYFEYFGEAAGPAPTGYYSFDVGKWHIVALNSTLDLSAGSRQGRWLADDIAKSGAKCMLAFMHHPRFSSGPHSTLPPARSGFQLLDRLGVDILVSGHDHIYERFPPMRADGKVDDQGVRQFIVGTGGAGLYAIRRVHPRSEARSDVELGVLKLTLHPEGYDWEFVPIISGFKDSGSGRCH